MYSIKPSRCNINRKSKTHLGTNTSVKQIKVLFLRAVIFLVLSAGISRTLIIFVSAFVASAISKRIYEFRWHEILRIFFYGIKRFRYANQGRDIFVSSVGRVLPRGFEGWKLLPKKPAPLSPPPPLQKKKKLLLS